MEEDLQTRGRGSARAAIALALLGALVGLSTVSYAALRGGVDRVASQRGERPAFAVTSTERAVLYPGQSTTYAVKVRWMSDVAGGVTLGVNGLPSGVTGTFVSRNAQLNAVTPPRPRATLIIEGSSAITPGRYPIAIVGSSTGVTQRTEAMLRIRRLPSSHVTLSVAPGSVATTTSATATYTVSIERSAFPDPVSLCLGSILPLGVTARFDPSEVPHDSATLTLTTTATARSGTFPFAIRARGPFPDGSGPASCRPPRVGRALDERRSSGRSFTTGTTGAIVVSGAGGGTGGGGSPTPTDDFTISGEAARVLYPGAASSPIELVFTNPTKATIYVTDVTVTVTGTSAGAACTAGDFATTPFVYGTPGSGGVPVGPGQTVSLTDAAVPQTSWPTVRMLDAGNQDACQGASVRLGFSDGRAYTP